MVEVPDRLVLIGTLALLCALAVADEAYFLAGVLGIGAAFTGGHLLGREGSRRPTTKRRNAAQPKAAISSLRWRQACSW